MRLQEIGEIMKKVMNILGIILLIISIVLIISGTLKFIIGIYDSYNNGIAKSPGFWNFSGASDRTMLYGQEGIDEYLDQFTFDFCILSLAGIIPAICAPIFTAILLRFKKIFNKNITKCAIVLLIACIPIHIIIFDHLIDEALVILPYIESVIISYIIARIYFKINYENETNNNTRSESNE